MDFLPDGTLYLVDPAALKIPETSAGSGATATLQGPGSGRRLPTLDTSSGFIDDGTLRIADPDALAVPDPNTRRTADPITPAKPISGSGSNWEWDWETGLVRETLDEDHPAGSTRLGEGREELGLVGGVLWEVQGA
jgi:hypothetical protein